MARSDDPGALDRSERLLSSAPPHTVEQVHVAAFERLAPAEREAVFDRLSRTAEPPADPSAAALGRAAARAEGGRRGALAQALGTDAAGAALSSAVSAAILGAVAAYAASSAAWEAWSAEGDEL
ncbi:hypothetical protein [Promicromonospora sp. MEB111]|uniref:hypothetical protein n=1 Tax=Promicromonospora sp. MEB111 TaxID=3040301 RepID=UPI00255189D2|nr:hypothetical protein [Promicromonospora sp. MEB111]